MVYRLLVYVECTGGEISEECIVDASLSWDEEGNYVDCTSEENQADGTTNCCKQEDQVGCCAGDKSVDIISYNNDWCGTFCQQGTHSS